VAAPTADVAARTEAVSKVYGRGGSAVTALDSITVDFLAGVFTAVMGPPGSGKSTLMPARSLSRPVLGGWPCPGRSPRSMAGRAGPPATLTGAERRKVLRPSRRCPADGAGRQGLVLRARRRAVR
jgi:ABC-type polysaccharide/polyol phosphate transport system ATPase subunit